MVLVTNVNTRLLPPFMEELIAPRPPQLIDSPKAGTIYQPTQSCPLSGGTRLYLPVPWYALQSLNLLPSPKKVIEGAWLRVTQSSTLLPHRRHCALQLLSTLLYTEIIAKVFLPLFEL